MMGESGAAFRRQMPGTANYLVATAYMCGDVVLTLSTGQLSPLRHIHHTETTVGSGQQGGARCLMYVLCDNKG